MRYEVELVLGATDASDIIRTPECWDIEQRSYPVYDHVAVLVVEDVTSLFLNGLSLLSGTVLLVAIQLSALQVGSQVVLHATQVLDQRQLRVGEEAEASRDERQAVDRSWWQQALGADFIAIVDRVFELMNEDGGEVLQPNYNQRYVGVLVGRRRSMFVTLQPLAGRARLRVQSANAASAAACCEAAALGTDVGKAGRLRIYLEADEVQAHADALREVSAQAIGEHLA